MMDLRALRDLRVLRDSGFSLLEIVVVVAVISILAAAVTPAIVQQIMDTRVAATQTEARALYEAMMGDVTQNRFGFVGDIGRQPDSFQELAQPSGLPSYTTTTTRGVGIGWRGPYINTGTSNTDYLTDSFGRFYTGASSGQVRSAGPDGIANNTDDIVYPPSAGIATGDLVVTVKTIQGNKTIVDPSGYRVDLFYASNGAEASVSDSTSTFTFSNVPMGLHAVRVVKTSNPQAGSIVAEDTVVVRPGSTTSAELWF
jgi:prepilin-type N-terminal cleavage/methylation domain-containing protein